MSNPRSAEIARKIRPAMTKLYVTYFRIAEQSDLTGPQLSVLSRLKERGPMRISQIAREEGIRMPTASNTLHQLERRELVQRVRDSEDRRGVRVELTDMGLSELSRVGEEREHYLAQMLDSLSEEDLQKAEDFADVINRLALNYTQAPESPTAG
ncbi:MarR family winged helix-turn-helix transcriptional regulator [Corynebacterium tapiri]|uniref:MarR family transcriptional regulator n=1 Tax=Corynebacterium tapiri TaxID=1448266 RepID=A0A5C4U1D0_9CORY|nr:MarR family transcriptional regulator [Corynebacterium tapiri]TNL95345.1 MarR family transcriptional regulator [Corynebacterium tapiri]